MPKRSLDKLEKQYKLAGAVNIFIAAVGITMTGVVIKKLITKKNVDSSSSDLVVSDLVEGFITYLENYGHGIGKVLHATKIAELKALKK